MKRLVKILSGNRGESLMEGIASLLIFTVLIAAVTSMIMVSLRITRTATEAADLRQSDANTILADAVSSVPATVELVFSEGENSIIEISVELSSEGDFVGFAPVTGGSGP